MVKYRLEIDETLWNKIGNIKDIKLKNSHTDTISYVVDWFDKNIVPQLKK